MPGPVCYDQGGEEPTVTDANVVLGYLNPEQLVGGEVRLKAARRGQCSLPEWRRRWASSSSTRLSARISSRPRT